MLGPLPLLYRVVVATVGLLAFVGLGAWTAHVVPAPLLPGLGAAAGAGLGALAVTALLHGSSSPAPSRQRLRRRPH